MSQVVGSLGSYPAIAPRVIAASSTVRDIGPMVSMDQTPFITPYLLTRPQLGLNPTNPHHAAGRRIDPPVSSPSDVAHRKAAVAAPEPLLEPPAEIFKSQGLRGVLNR